VALVLFAAAAQAQTVAGVIRGVVSDASNKPVAGATLSLTSLAANTLWSARSGKRGEFTFAAVPPGQYRLKTECRGFQSYTRALEVAAGVQARVGITLQPAVEESITLDGGDPMPILQADSPAMSSVTEDPLLLGLPLDGRDFYQLSLLVPGVLPAAEGSAGSVRGAFSISVNGAREDANSFLLDGVYDGDPKLNGVGVTPPREAIGELDANTSTYDASFGRNAGGQLNVATRSGTNFFHGSAYEFFRSRALDGNNFFAPSGQPAPAYRRNQFGGTLGGPLVKSRTFFFTDTEGTRQAAGQTLVSNVPTAAERSGDFSLAGLPAIDPTTRQPIPGGKLPQYYLSPIGLALAALYPQPNRGVAGANFVSSPSLTDGLNKFDVKLDQLLRDPDRFTARYSFADDALFEPFAGSSGDPAVPGYGLRIPNRAENVMWAEMHTFSQNLLNELRLAFNRVSNGDYPEGQGVSVNRRLGLPELSLNPRDWGLTLTSVDGFSSIGNEPTSPEHGTTNTYQIADTVDWIRAPHLFKLGFDFRLLQQNAWRDIESHGFFNFTGLLLGNPLEELLLGAPTETGGARENNPQHLRTHSDDFFASDYWRIRPGLTLTLGLRYEYNSPAADAAGRADVYNPATGSLVQLGQGGFPRGGYNPDRRNFAPRLGLAWSPGQYGATVLRAAYGIYHDQSSLAPGEGIYFSAPYYNFNAYYPVPGLVNLSLSNPFPSDFPFPYPGSAIAFQRDLRTPYMQQWNFGVQRRMGSGRTAEIAYVGSKGTHLIDSRNINQPRPSVNQQNPGPNPGFSEIDIIESQANSIYHSLQARFQQRFSRGLSMLASYTIAKSIDDGSGFFSTAGDPNFPQNAYDLRAERGRSDFDVRQRFAMGYGYDLPLFRSHPRLGGWQTFGVLAFQTGRPFTVALLPDVDNSNTGISQLGFGAGNRPDVTGDPRLSNPSAREWFNTAAFAVAPYGHFGDAGRNILDGPGLRSVSLSLVKNTTLTCTCQLKLQFRAEFFNALNRANLNLPDNFAGSPTFGQVVSAQDPRRVQFAVKVWF